MSALGRTQYQLGEYEATVAYTCAYWKAHWFGIPMGFDLGIKVIYSSVKPV